MEATPCVPQGPYDGGLDAWVDALADMYVRRSDPRDTRVSAKARFFRLAAELLAEASRPEREWQPVRRCRLCKPGGHRGVRLADGILAGKHWVSVNRRTPEPDGQGPLAGARRARHSAPAPGGRRGRT